MIAIYRVQTESQELQPVGSRQHGVEAKSRTISLWTHRLLLEMHMVMASDETQCFINNVRNFFMALVNLFVFSCFPLLFDLFTIGKRRFFFCVLFSVFISFQKHPAFSQYAYENVRSVRSTFFYLNARQIKI